MRHTVRSTREHRALGAKMAPFGGWDMPIQYRGVLEEHRACRERRGRVRRVAPRHRRVRRPGRVRRAAVAAHQRPRPHRPGPGAVHAPARPGRRARRRRHHRVVGRARALPRDAERVEHRPARRRDREAPIGDGGVDARRRHRDARRARGAGPERAGAARDGRAPRRPPSRASTCAIGGASGSSPAPATRARTASRSTCRRPTRPRCGTRSSAPASRRPGSARATRCGSKPGCRCTATSSGPGITPLQAGLGWVVRWDKGDFRGRAALDGRAGARRRRAGCAASRSRAGARRARARPCCSTVPTSASVTSGNFSPTLGHAIALGFLSPDVEPGAEVEVDVRGRPLPATVVKPPFVKR